MRFLRHGEIYPFDEGALAHRTDEFRAGCSLAGCTPAEPASASPASRHLALPRLGSTMKFQRTATSVLTVCLTQGDNPRPGYGGGMRRRLQMIRAVGCFGYSSGQMVPFWKRLSGPLRRRDVGVRLLVVFSAFVCMAAFALENYATAKSADTPALDALLGKNSLIRQEIPLSEALRTLGISTERGYVSFGLEVYVTGGREPTLDMDVQPGSTGEEGLRQILAQLPLYDFRVLSPHFVEIFPLAAITDARDPLNMKVDRFDVDGIPAGMIMEWPDAFIPELKAKREPAAKGGAKHVDLFVGGVAGGATISIHLRNVTVREILNAVAKTTEQKPFRDYPMGWQYSFDPKTSFKPGGVQSWKVLLTLPFNWNQQARAAGVSVP